MKSTGSPARSTVMLKRFCLTLRKGSQKMRGIILSENRLRRYVKAHLWKSGIYEKTSTSGTKWQISLCDTLSPFIVEPSMPYHNLKGAHGFQKKKILGNSDWLCSQHSSRASEHARPASLQSDVCSFQFNRQSQMNAHSYNRSLLPFVPPSGKRTRFIDTTMLPNFSISICWALLPTLVKLSV